MKLNEVNRVKDTAVNGLFYCGIEKLLRGFVRLKRKKIGLSRGNMDALRAIRDHSFVNDFYVTCYVGTFECLPKATGTC